MVSLLELKDFFTEGHDDTRIWLRIAWTTTEAPTFSGEMQRLREGNVGGDGVNRNEKSTSPLLVLFGLIQMTQGNQLRHLSV
jgi:hypothetical protein